MLKHLKIAKQIQSNKASQKITNGVGRQAQKQVLAKKPIGKNRGSLKHN